MEDEQSSAGGVLARFRVVGVPVRHHLVDPIRPTRGHTAISPHGGLYAMPSLCGTAEANREWFPVAITHSRRRGGIEIGYGSVRINP
jgi:hypothetical protein